MTPEANLPLYAINADIAKIMNMAKVDEDTGEVILDDELEKQLDELETAHHVKVLSIASMVKNLKAMSEAIALEQRILAARKAGHERKIDWLKRYLIGEACHTSTYEDGSTKVTFRKSTVVKILDEALIPNDYWMPKEPAISKTEIGKDLKAGEEIPGAELEQRMNVVIK